LTFVPAFLSGYLFINTSQACGEQFTRRRFFLFLAFVPAFQGGYLFFNTSQACGEQFTRRRFFLFLAFVPAFQGGYLFFNASQRLTAADRPRTHSCRCALFLFLR